MKEAAISSMDNEAKNLFEEAINLIKKDKKRAKEGRNDPNIDEFVEILRQMEILQKKITEKSKIDASKLNDSG